MGSPDIVVRDPKDLTPPTGAHYVKPLSGPSPLVRAIN